MPESKGSNGSSPASVNKAPSSTLKFGESPSKILARSFSISRAFDFKIAPTQPERRTFAHGAYYDSAITCKFEIAPDCQPGQYPFRLLTATQLTHISSFHVSPFLTIEETPERKDTRETAMPVTANVTINAKLGYDMADFYRVPVKAGEELSVELDSVRISDVSYGDSTFDLAARVLDSDGKELASNDDNSFHRIRCSQWSSKKMAMFSWSPSALSHKSPKPPMRSTLQKTDALSSPFHRAEKRERNNGFG